MRHHPPLVATLLALCACNSRVLQPAAPSMNSAPAEAAAKNARLFVSEPDNGFVAVYDGPSMKLVTILQTFNRPQGECADNDGDVWVVDAGDKKIDELDYAGKMVAQLQDKSGTPYS